MTIKNQSLLNLNEQFIPSIIKDLIDTQKGSKLFPEHKVKELLKTMGFPVPNGIYISKDTANQISLRQLPFKYPLAAKIFSSKISSKSDVKGVILDIKNVRELKNATKKLSLIESCEGILIEEMAPKGVEVIIGGIIDNQFGPVVMFGIGGIFVELYKDVAFALAPADEKDALWLIKQVKGYKLLEGYRGSPPVDIAALISMIVAISKIIEAGLILEIDLNPVVLYPKGALVLDAKIFIV